MDHGSFSRYVLSLQGSEPSFLALLSIFYSVRGTDEICVNTYLVCPAVSIHISVHIRGEGGGGEGGGGGKSGIRKTMT